MIGMKLIKNPKFGVIKASCSINDDKNECKKMRCPSRWAVHNNSKEKQKGTNREKLKADK